MNNKTKHHQFPRKNPHPMSQHTTMSPIIILLILCLLPFTLSSPTVYDILPKFGLPPGLLPDTVQSYTLSEDGTFSVDLSSTCYIQFDYLVYYESRITGVLKYGSITKLKGIQVKRLFVWFGVDEIRVDLPPADSIYFQVGFINKRLGIDQFQTVHSCRDNVNKFGLELLAGVEDNEMLLTE